MELNLLGLLIMVGIGGILLIVGIMISVHAINKTKRCCKKTQGTIIKHSYLNTAFTPIVEYNIDGKSYKTKRKFEAVIKTKTFWRLYSDEDAYVSDRNFLHIKAGAITNLSGMAQRLYPLNSILTVYYNPQKPKEAFVEIPPRTFSFVSIAFTISAAFSVLCGIFLYFVV